MGIDALSAFEKADSARVTENAVCNALLDDSRTPTVFDLVDLTDTTALAPQQLADHGRPTQMCCVGEMEDVVKAIAIILATVVSQSVADLTSTFVENDFRRFGIQLLNSHGKPTRKTLPRGECGIVEAVG
jgi:hypothetical protein